jgi:4-amino-4-deoxy-L-arabinose transferase-like glycosyltransferase
MLAGVGLILVSNIYYPFYLYDELVRYAYQAKLIYQTRTIPTGVLGYPQQVQLIYAYAFMASGGVVEWVARLAPTLLAAGALGATVALGRGLFGERAGLLAGLTLLLTPMYAQWAMSGYIDVPTAFFITLAALATYHWWDSPSLSRAAWAGLWLGLALWTKQSALLQLGGAGLFVGLNLLRKGRWRTFRGWQKVIVGGLGMLAAALLVAGPWYLRNALLTDVQQVFPSTGEYAAVRANPSRSNLVPFVAHPDHFGAWLGYLYAAGLAGGLAGSILPPGVWQAEAAGGEPERAAQAWGARLLVCFTVPHLLIWWQRFSYNPRHLLTIAPLFAVLVGYALSLISGLLRTQWRIPVAAALIGLAALAWPWSLRYYGLAPYGLLTDPGRTLDDKRHKMLGGSYQVIGYIREHVEPGMSISTMDPRLAYYLDDYSVVGEFPITFDPLDSEDYFVVVPWVEGLYETLDHPDSPVLAAIKQSDEEIGVPLVAEIEPGDNRNVVMREVFRTQDGYILYELDLIER